MVNVVKSRKANLNHEKQYRNEQRVRYFQECSKVSSRRAM